MVRSVPVEYLSKWSSSEGTENCDSDINWTWCICCHHENCYPGFILCLEKTIIHLKSIKVKIYSVENVKDCCDLILVDADHLDSSRDFNSKYFGYITNIFEDTSDSRFFFGKLISTRRLQSLLINVVCVTRVLCKLRGSLAKSPLFKRIQANSATLLTQSGGNLLNTRKSFKMSLCLHRIAL